MRRLRLAAIATLIAVVLAISVVEPLVELLFEAFGGGALDRFASLATDSRHRGAAFNSLLLSVLTVLLCGVFGTSLALLLWRLGRAGRILGAIAISPLFLPPILGTMSFYFLADKGGVVDRLLGGYGPDFQGFGAVLAVHVLTMFVFFLLLPAAALANFDAGLLAAARTLGAGPVRTLRTVVLPLLVPALSAAAVLTFMGSMASFTAPWVFGGLDRYLTTAIVTARQDEPAVASCLAVVLTVLSLLSLLASGRRRKVMSSAKGAARPEPFQGFRRAWRLVVAGVLAVLPALPFLTLLLVSMKPGGRIGRAPLFSELGFENYRDSMAAIFETHTTGPSADLIVAIGRSALYAILATAGNVVFALVFVLAGVRWPKLLRVGMNAIAMLPIAIPGTVVGLAFVAAFSEHGPLGLGPPLLGTAAILVIAYFARGIPVVVRAVDAGLAQLSPALPEAARTLGATPARVLRTVVLPHLLPSLVGGGLLAFVASMGEFVASILLWAPATKPASVAIFEDFGSGLFGTAAAAGVIYSLVTVLLAVLGRALLGSRDSRNALGLQ